MEEKEKKAKTAAHKEPAFEGYTMEELRYQLALTALKKEYLKEKATDTVSAIKKQLPLVNGNSTLPAKATKGLFGKIMRGLDFADYLIIGFQGVRIFKRLGTIFRRKRQ